MVRITTHLVTTAFINHLIELRIKCTNRSIQLFVIITVCIILSMLTRILITILSCATAIATIIQVGLLFHFVFSILLLIQNDLLRFTSEIINDCGGQNLFNEVVALLYGVCRFGQVVNLILKWYVHIQAVFLSKHNHLHKFVVLLVLRASLLLLLQWFILNIATFHKLLLGFLGRYSIKLSNSGCCILLTNTQCLRELNEVCICRCKTALLLLFLQSLSAFCRLLRCLLLQSLFAHLL